MSNRENDYDVNNSLQSIQSNIRSLLQGQARDITLTDEGTEGSAGEYTTWQGMTISNEDPGSTKVGKKALKVQKTPRVGWHSAIYRTLSTSFKWGDFVSCTFWVYKPSGNFTNPTDKLHIGFIIAHNILKPGQREAINIGCQPADTWVQYTITKQMFDKYSHYGGISDTDTVLDIFWRLSKVDGNPSAILYIDGLNVNLRKMKSVKIRTITKQLIAGTEFSDLPSDQLISIISRIMQNDKDRRIRERAALTLAFFDIEAAKPILKSIVRESIKKNELDWKSSQAVLTLEKSGLTKELLLLDLLKDKDETVHDNASRLLKIMGVELPTEIVSQQFSEFFNGQKEVFKNAFETALTKIATFSSVEDFKRRFAMNMIQELSHLLKDDELDHREFDLEAMKPFELWRPLQKIIMLKRIQELKNCTIIQVGRKYDICEIKTSYLGSIIVSKLGFGKRSKLTLDEYQKLISQINKLQYEVPVTIKPTSTEDFFSE